MNADAGGQASPPRLALALLSRCLPSGFLRETILGDLTEIFLERAGSSRFRASFWFWSQTIRVGGGYLLRRMLFPGLYHDLSSERPSAGTRVSDTSYFAGILGDLRIGLRSYGKNPAFTLAVSTVLGIGIGAVSLVFSLFNTVVLRPLPFEEPERLVWVRGENELHGEEGISFPDYLDYREQATAFESLSAYRFTRTRVYTGGDAAALVSPCDVSVNFLSTLGVAPMLGRDFIPEDGEEFLAPVIILSHRFWMTNLGGDPGALGSALTLNAQTMTVVGIMPAGFEYPEGTDAWQPIQRNAGYNLDRADRSFSVIGRLRSGRGIELARDQMRVITASIGETFPDGAHRAGVRLSSLHDHHFGHSRRLLLLIAALAAVVPLVATANAANLMLARGISRDREIACRMALGASSGRVIRQLLTESALLGIFGAALGLGICYVGGEALRAFAATALPRMEEIRIDGFVVTATLVTSFLLVTLTGFAPALWSRGIELTEVLRGMGGRWMGGKHWQTRDVLVVVQVSLSFLLLVTSGLLVRSYFSVQAVDPGFKAEGLARIRVQLPMFRYAGSDDLSSTLRTAWGDVSQGILTVPGVVAVSRIDRPPMGGEGTELALRSRDRLVGAPAEWQTAYRREVGIGIFSVEGLSLLDGRSFGPDDVHREPAPVVINHSLSEALFPGEEPLGKIVVQEGDPGFEAEVIGVVSDIREFGPDRATPPIVYVFSDRQPRYIMDLLIRSAGAPPTILAAFREAVIDVDSDIAVAQVEMMDARVSNYLREPRFRSTVLGILALVALLLASIGLYGVLALFVQHTSHELCVRVALGAGQASLGLLVLRRGFLLVGPGILIGLCGGLAGGKLLEGLLFGVSPTDPVTFLGVGATLTVVSLVALMVPTHRALKVAPAEIMRTG